ncbi:MAG: hypothetical protein BWX64_01536 [Acidobacteria bacterium ADurb.Bin051]|nr:MAG: hypothetical protein BWX64_01536 [Acidobacteria bacterium ADurb.Bin051]
MAPRRHRLLAGQQVGEVRPEPSDRVGPEVRPAPDEDGGTGEPGADERKQEGAAPPVPPLRPRPPGDRPDDDERQEEGIGLGREREPPEGPGTDHPAGGAPLPGDRERGQGDGEERHRRVVLRVREEIAGKPRRGEEEQDPGRRREQPEPAREEGEPDEDEQQAEAEVHRLEAVERVEPAEPPGEEHRARRPHDVRHRVVLPGAGAEGRGGEIRLVARRVRIGREVEIARVEAREVGEVPLPEEEIAEGGVPGHVARVERREAEGEQRESEQRGDDVDTAIRRPGHPLTAGRTGATARRRRSPASRPPAERRRRAPAGQEDREHRVGPDRPRGG